MDKPWFKFTANNWLSGSVQLLSDAEKGTYIDLISMIWKEDGSIKLDKILARKLRLDYATVCERIDSYCELNIMVCEDDVLSIKFLSDQLEAFDEVSKKNSDNAKKRWAKEKKPMPPHANKKREEKKREEKISDYPFELFWEMYDKKTGKPKCESKYEKLSEEIRKTIFGHVLKYKESQPDKQFRKNPDTYLNQQSWNDEIVSSNQQEASTKTRNLFEGLE